MNFGKFLKIITFKTTSTVINDDDDDDDGLALKSTFSKYAHAWRRKFKIRSQIDGNLNASVEANDRIAAQRKTHLLFTIYWWFSLLLFLLLDDKWPRINFYSTTNNMSWIVQLLLFNPSHSVQMQNMNWPGS